jgi:tetratricopeptide (TPR) repeat protein
MKKTMVALLLLTSSQFPVSWAVDSFWEDTAGAASKKSNAGIERIRSGDLEGARRLFKQAVALDPENAGFWANLGMVQVDLGEEEAALKSFRRGLSVDPSNKLLRKNIKELQGSSTSAAVGASGDVEIINLNSGEVDLVTSLTDDAIEVRYTILSLLLLFSCLFCHAHTPRLFHNAILGR